MAVGAFGLGSSAPGTELKITDFNTATRSGFYIGAGTGTSNGPSANFPGMVIVVAHSDSRCAQITIATNGNIHARAKTGGVWGEWKQVAFV
jgi:hypothetical protein